jgi:cytochrome c peroxidase
MTRAQYARRLHVTALLLSSLLACGGDGDLPLAAGDAAAAREASAASDHDADAADATDAAAADPDADATVDDMVEPLTPALRARLMDLRYDHAAAPSDPSNRWADDPDARSFGKVLFFDSSLSGPLLEGDNNGGPATLGMRGETGRVSCSGCHVPGSSFVDTRSPHRQISLASGWTRRRTPTLLEVGFQPLYNWDGGHDSLWSQALGVMENANEFNSGRLFVAQQVFRLHRARYEAVFGALPPLDDAARFPALSPEQAGCAQLMTRTGVVLNCRGKPGDAADYDRMAEADQRAVTRVAVNVAKALSAYVRQLRCGPSRFDTWLDGGASADGALAPAEQRGAALFVGRGKCNDCHTGPRLSDGKFHNIGLAPAEVAVAFTDANDRGAADGVAQALASALNSRGAFSDGDRGVLPASAAPELLGAFRTPALRCIAAQPSFMHTGQLRTLEQVINFHNRGGDAAGGYPGRSELAPLGLNQREEADLAAFLRTLQGPGPEPSLLMP